eukprot:4472286-Amphidinium_carterae.1
MSAWRYMHRGRNLVDRDEEHACASDLAKEQRLTHLAITIVILPAAGNCHRADDNPGCSGYRARGD